MIIDEVLPLLCEIRLTDLNILTTVLEMYRVMLSDRKYGLTMTVLATRVLPVLIPQMVNSSWTAASPAPLSPTSTSSPRRPCPSLTW